MTDFTFERALPVWAKGRQTEMNLSLVFRAVVCRGRATLRISGHTNYMIFINGSFFSQGPARAGHGFFRADEISLDALLTKEKNVVAVLAAGYNVNSFYLTDQPSFLCAEIVSGSEILYATGTEKEFSCREFTERTKKVQRYSFQRPFTESYALSQDTFDIFTDPELAFSGAELEKTEKKRFITRDTPVSDYEIRRAKSVVNEGKMEPVRGEPRKYGDRSYTGVDGVYLKGFKKEELSVSAVDELYKLQSVFSSKHSESAASVCLSEDGFAILDMGLNTTGFMAFDVETEGDTVIWAVFNEHLDKNGGLDPGFGGTASVVRWELKEKGFYRLVSFEPYTYRYLQLISMGGEAKITNARQYAEHYPAAGLTNLKTINDPDLRLIYDAAVETFRQNATDIFMDCPSRERAGWLCDSFFTSRSEYTLTGKSLVERAFLENFIMEDGFGEVPEGMLPMCYPSDHPGGGYIPNWAMWYLLELREYGKRSGDKALIEKAKDKMYSLAAFFEGFENEDGLLENLESWVFIEWSKANDFTQDVNYPSNMLYAKFLRDLGELYDDAYFKQKSERLKETIRQKAFNGTFFIDNAVRENGELKNTENHTETAQYYALFTGVASKTTHPELYDLMLGSFGPSRDPETQYTDVPVSNAFIGNYLRLEILFENGEYDKLLSEIKAFFLPMAQKTGTIWENMHDSASCCHGFASHLVYWLNGMF